MPHIADTSLLVNANGIPTSWSSEDVIKAFLTYCPLNPTNPIIKRTGQLVTLAMADPSSRDKLVQAGFRKYRGAIIILSQFMRNAVEKVEFMITGLGPDVHPFWVYAAVKTNLSIPITRLAYNPATGTFFITVLSSGLALPTTISYRGRTVKLRSIPERSRHYPKHLPEHRAT